MSKRDLGSPVLTHLGDNFLMPLRGYGYRYGRVRIAVGGRLAVATYRFMMVTLLSLKIVVISVNQ
jgi:hypothetical protein